MIAKWILVGWMSLGTLLIISTVGKPRKPLTPNGAVVVLLLNIAVVTTIILFWKG